MWMEKLWEGVLRVLTPLGPRYLQPTLSQRIYLLWIFRNFQTLPVKVLTPFQLRFIERMSEKQGFAQSSLHGFEDMPVLGTLEQRPSPDSTSASSPRRPNATVTEAVSSFAVDQRS